MLATILYFIYLFLLWLIHMTLLCILPSGSVRVFEALDSDPALVKTIDAHSPVSRLLHLKEGAQVSSLPHKCGVTYTEEQELNALTSFVFLFSTPPPPPGHVDKEPGRSSRSGERSTRGCGGFSAWETWSVPSSMWSLWGN